MITLLLQFGADPNSPNPMKFLNKIQYAIDIGSNKKGHNYGLIKLLLSYGSQFGSINTTYQYFPKRSLAKQQLAWIMSIQGECQRLYTVLTQGEKLLAAGQYGLAKAKLKEAKKLLNTFATEEENKLSDPSYGTHEAYVNDYHYRADRCREKIALCEEHLQSEHTSLLATPSLGRTKQD